MKLGGHPPEEWFRCRRRVAILSLRDRTSPIFTSIKSEDSTSSLPYGTPRQVVALARTDRLDPALDGRAHFLYL
jgi:hypothetical protein